MDHDEHGLRSHYWVESFNPSIVTPKKCPLGTPEDDMVLMANHVVASLSAVLFSKLKDKHTADQEAYRLWSEYCS